MMTSIEIHDINEFSEIRLISNSAINKTMLSNIKELSEKEEIEPFIREILYDETVTPHGPTEIADILTHLHVKGQKRLAAFVLKGKSFKKVSSKDVTHQFAKLRQIQGLRLIVLGAVGNIQDDAQRDFIQAAQDIGCEYLIIKAHDLARLFIAYWKVCPKDGIPYSETGTCKNGHKLDQGISLEIVVREKIKYTTVRQEDLSHNGAKRYSAIILLDKHYSKEVIRRIIHEVSQELKHSNYYRNERIKARWGKTQAQVVWLYLANDAEDIRTANWVCRTCWIDSALPPPMRPFALKGNEKLGEIDVEWNDDYKLRKESYEGHFGTKEEVLRSVQSILRGMVESAKQAISYFEDYSKGRIPEPDFISKMQEIEPKVRELYFESGDIPHPPPDCEDYDTACQNIFATIDDMFLYYSESGLTKWSKKNRDKLMQNAIDKFHDELKVIEIEERKIH